jgi:hypothetical protein
MKLLLAWGLQVGTYGGIRYRYSALRELNLTVADDRK